MRTLRETANGRYEEKKSVFLSRVLPVRSEEEARAKIADYRKENKGARHTVFAYIIDGTPVIERMSDDGEPQGTGGLPLLSLLQGRELKNVCLMVSRIFGGILLGVGGLSRAYKKAGEEALAQALFWQTTCAVEVTARLAYDIHAKLRPLLSTCQVVDEAFSDEVRVTLWIEQTKAAERMEELQSAAMGRLIWEKQHSAVFYRRSDGLLEPLE
ncbi:hypothetical protein ABB02_02037 [Clostridiaceae bacterium JG1575]|nr:hypothetical protein ABB02_02037 [Clostridiaceae bacterium JG1575]